MAVFTSNTTFDSLDSNGVASVFTNVGAGVTTLHNTASGSTASITRLVDGAANALTVVAQDTTTGSEGATAFTTLTANNGRNYHAYFRFEYGGDTYSDYPCCI